MIRRRAGVADLAAALADVRRIGRADMRRAGQEHGRLEAGESGGNALRLGDRIDAADPPARDHVARIADAAALVRHGRRRDAEGVEIGERADPGRVLADPGVVEDHGAQAGLCGEIARIAAAMRARYHHLSGGVGRQLGDGVGREDSGRDGMDQGHGQLRCLSYER